MAVLDLSLGPILLGTFLNVWLHGIMVMQATLYWITQKHDKWWIKGLVIWILVLETCNSAFDIGFIYRYTITLFGDFPALAHSHWLIHNEPLMTVTIAATTQSFFAWRIARLTGRAWIGWAIVSMTIVQFFAGLVTTIGAVRVVDFARYSELKTPIGLWLVASAVTDVTITCFLTWYLQTHRTGFSRTDSIITKIIRLAVPTGMITTIWAITNLILYLALPNNLHLFFNVPLCKLYSNSFLSILNSRNGWGADMVVPAVEVARNMAVHVSVTSEGDSGIAKQEEINRAAIQARKRAQTVELKGYSDPRSMDIERDVGRDVSVEERIDEKRIDLDHPRLNTVDKLDEWSQNSRSIEHSR